jgi:hypothetical protein
MHACHHHAAAAVAAAAAAGSKCETRNIPHKRKQTLKAMSKVVRKQVLKPEGTRASAMREKGAAPIGSGWDCPKALSGPGGPLALSFRWYYTLSQSSILNARLPSAPTCTSRHTWTSPPFQTPCPSTTHIISTHTHTRTQGEEGSCLDPCPWDCRLPTVTHSLTHKAPVCGVWTDAHDAVARRRACSSICSSFRVAVGERG